MWSVSATCVRPRPGLGPAGPTRRLPAVCLDRPPSRTKNVKRAAPGQEDAKGKGQGRGKGSKQKKGKGAKAFGGKLRRPALERVRPEGSPQVRGLEDLSVGEVLVGRVRVVVSYGLIVNLKGVAVDGLLHQSEFPADDRGLASRCGRGTVVHVAVKGVDPAAGQLALTLRRRGCYVEKKRVKAAKLNEGDLYEGRVKKIAEAGVFVDFGAQVQGFRASGGEEAETVFLRQRVFVEVGNCDPEHMRVRRMVPVRILSQAELEAAVAARADKECEDGGEGDDADDGQDAVGGDAPRANAEEEIEGDGDDDEEDDDEEEEWTDEDEFYDRYAELDDL